MRTIADMIQKEAVTLRSMIFAALAISTGFISQNSWADVSPALDRFSLSVGGFHVKPEIGARLGTQYGSLDSGDHKTNTVTLPRISADLLLFESQGLSFDYYRYRKTWSDGAGAFINLGGGSGTNAAANLQLKTEIDIAKLAYKWWMGSGSTVVGLGAGAAYYRLGVNASGDVSVGSEGRKFSADTSESAIAPLLELGLRHAITPDFRVFFDASGIWKTGGKAHGNIYNASVGAEWFPIKNIGFVASYGVTDIDLKYDSDVNAKVRVKLPGPSLFLKARF